MCLVLAVLTVEPISRSCTIDGLNLPLFEVEREKIHTSSSFYSVLCRIMGCDGGFLLASWS